MKKYLLAFFLLFIFNSCSQEEIEDENTSSTDTKEVKVYGNEFLTHGKTYDMNSQIRLYGFLVTSGKKTLTFEEYRTNIKEVTVYDNNLNLVTTETPSNGVTTLTVDNVGTHYILISANNSELEFKFLN